MINPSRIAPCLALLVLVAAPALAQDLNLRNLDTRTACIGEGCGDGAVCTLRGREDPTPELLLCSTAAELLSLDSGPPAFMRLTGDLLVAGDVGIGTTDPEVALHVYTGAAVPANLRLEGNSAGYQFIDLNGPTDEKVAQAFVNDSKWRLRGLNDALSATTVAGISLELDTGNVGIGSFNPDRALHVRSTTSTLHFFKLETTAPGSRAGIELITAAADWQVRAETTARFEVVDDLSNTRPLQIVPGTPTNTLFLDDKGHVGVGTLPNDRLTAEGPLSLAETVEPVHSPGYGKIWPEDDNCLWFKDGDGFPHSLHCDAYGTLTALSVTGPLTQSITAQDRWTRVLVYETVGAIDAQGNIGSNPAAASLTLGPSAAGAYDLYWGISADSDEAGRNFVTGIGIQSRIPTTITDVTATALIVVTTSLAHGLRRADGVELSGVVGVPEANGSFFVDVLSSTSFALYDLDGDPVAGTGAYVSGGTIDFVVDKGTIAWRTLGTIEIGDQGRSAIRLLEAGDEVFVVTANTESTADLNVYSSTFSVERRSD